MSYFPDENTDSLNVPIHIGWLDKAHEFRTGMPPVEFVEELKLLCLNRVRQTRGFHLCPFCERPAFGVPLEVNGKRILLGSAELEIRCKDGSTFVAPDLIVHYIFDHRYLPSGEFIEAVRSK